MFHSHTKKPRKVKVTAGRERRPELFKNNPKKKHLQDYEVQFRVIIGKSI